MCIAHKDRLCRFAYDLLETIFKTHGAEIVVEADDAHSPEHELAEDLVSIITVFGARLYGGRSSRKRRKQNHDTLTDKLHSLINDAIAKCDKL